MRPGLYFSELESFFIKTWLLPITDLWFIRIYLYLELLFYLSALWYWLSATGLSLRSHQKGWGRYRKVQQRRGEKQDGSDLSIYLWRWVWTFSVAQSLWRRAKGAEKKSLMPFSKQWFQDTLINFSLLRKRSGQPKFQNLQIIYVTQKAACMKGKHIYFV